MIFDAFVDFLFCIRLLIDLNSTKDTNNELHTRNIKVLLQFLANSFDNSDFEYYCLNNEEYLYLYYLSLKHKNSSIFKGFIFIYTFLVNRFLAPILEYIFTANKVYKFTSPLNDKLVKQIKNNFGYEYLRDYKRYWSDDKEYYKQIRFKVFFEETIINLYNWWNKVVTKNNRQSKLFINTDTLFFDIERYF